jgi:hypothetical protein
MKSPPERLSVDDASGGQLDFAIRFFRVRRQMASGEVVKNLGCGFQPPRFDLDFGRLLLAWIHGASSV